MIWHHPAPHFKKLLRIHFCRALKETLPCLLLIYLLFARLILMRKIVIHVLKG